MESPLAVEIDVVVEVVTDPDKLIVTVKTCEGLTVDVAVVVCAEVMVLVVI